jgi:uncharacterized protein YcfL
MKYWIFAMSCILLMAGCSSTSEVKVYNETGGTINVSLNDTSHLMFDGDMIEEEFIINHYVLFSDEVKVPLRYDESLYLSGRNKSVSLKANETKKIHIRYDRAGLEVRNISGDVAIMGIYFKDEVTDQISDNILTDFINPLSIEIVPSSLDHGYVMIQDVFGAWYTSDDVLENEAGVTKSISFDAFEVVVLGY